MSLKGRITEYVEAPVVEIKPEEKLYQYYTFDTYAKSICQRMKRHKRWTDPDHVTYINLVFPGIHTAEEVEHFLLNDFKNVARAPVALIDDDCIVGRFICSGGVVRRITLGFTQMTDLIAPASLADEVK